MLLPQPIGIGKMMAAEIPGNVAVVEVSPLGSIAETSFGRDTQSRPILIVACCVANGPPRQILSNLWLVPGYVFLAESSEGLSALVADVGRLQ